MGEGHEKVTWKRVVHYLELPDQTVPVELLRLPKAQAVAHYLMHGEQPFARLIELRRDERTGRETVVLDIDVQRPQQRAHPIRSRERIAIRFLPADDTWPEVLALRADFPHDVPHLNLTPEGYPRSLCLYETPYDELKLRWTAPSFVERIRYWLAATAIGTLHAADQPLEPFLLPYATYLILPDSLLSGGEGELVSDVSDVSDVSASAGRDDSKLSSNAATAAPAYDASQPSSAPLFVIERRDQGDGRQVYAMTRNVMSVMATKRRGARASQETQEVDLPTVAAMILQGDVQTHGLIARQPTTLRELHAFLRPAGIDLLSRVRAILGPWRREVERLRAHLVIIAILPKRRSVESAAEAPDVWAFYLASSMEDLGEQVGIWRKGAGLIVSGMHIPQAVEPVNLARDGAETSVVVLNSVFTLSRERAARLNGVAAPLTSLLTRVVAVGVGALGSQTFANLVRAGFGTWTLIDEDVVLPHNRARYAAFGVLCDGLPKAYVMARLANLTLAGSPIARHIVADALHPERAPTDQTAALAAAYAEAEVILDMSASVAVARFLARDVPSAARRASFFVTPSGTDAALLVEDRERTIPLDVLEMQYYRFLIRTPAWSDHLMTPPLQVQEGQRGAGGPVRYGRSCRDVSSPIPHNLIAVHAANGSHVLRTALEQPVASLRLWHADAAGNVRAEMVSVAPAVFIEQQGWTIITDEWLLEYLAATRAACLPRETGGILVGSWDMQRRLLYVADALPSPSDSRETPSGYIRGRERMPEELTRIEQTTQGMLDYMGEWHAHPQGHSSRPSQVDEAAFAALGTLRRADTLPLVMLIVGDEGDITWQVDAAESFS